MKNKFVRFISVLGCLSIASLVSEKSYSQTTPSSRKASLSETKKDITVNTQLQGGAPEQRKTGESFAPQKQQFISTSGDMKIGRLIISGLERTRESVVRDAADVKEGELLSDFDVDQFVQNLYRSGIVMKVTVEFVKNGNVADIVVKIDEKWALVPIPFAQYSDDTRGAGLILMDANFLGLNKKALLGLTYFNTGWMGMMSIASPGNRLEDIFYSIAVMGGRKDYRNTDMKKNTDVRYTAKYGMSDASIGYRFTSGFSAELSGGTNTFDISKKSGAGAEEIDSATFIKYGCKFTFNHQKFAPLRSTGFFSFLETNGYSRWSDGDPSSVSKLFIHYSTFLFGSSVFSAYGSAGVSSGSLLLTERIGGKPCFKSLPMDMIISDRYAGGGTSFEVLAFDAKKAAVYFVGEAEAGSFRSMEYNESIEHFGGYGGGVRIYLKGVAFPALGVEVMRNYKTGKMQTLASLGVGF